MPPGLIAGRYRVVRAVGRGGMGTVWLCHDEVLNRDVAVKQIRTEPGEESASSVRAMREARLSAAASHQNAVSLYDIVNHEGSPWLVMEYVPSRTLGDVMREEGRLSPPRVARIGAQLAAALANAHALGIIHRDIKPGNVLIGENDLAKISDFGIARGHRDERLTLTGLVTGTPTYFSPELARGGEPSQASDVWALGATLYAAVEGRPPYESESNPLAMLARIAAERPPPPLHAGPLTSTLSSMLDPNPATRASMPAVLAALTKLADPSDLAASRARERDRAYSDTTLDQQPIGILGAMLSGPETQGTERLTNSPGDGSSAPPPPPTSTPDEPAEGRGTHRPSLALIALGIAAVLVLFVAGALAWVALTSSPTADQSAPQTSAQPRHGAAPGTASDTSATTATSPTPTTQPTTQPTTVPTNSPTTAPTTPPTTPPSKPPKSPKSPKSPKPPPASSAQAMVNFTTSYFNTVPGDLNTGWAQLAPSFQQAIGRSSYDSFWGSIDSVDVANVQAVPGSLAVDYTITYHFSDGTDSLERKRLSLVPHGSSFWITKDTSIG